MIRRTDWPLAVGSLALGLIAVSGCIEPSSQAELSVWAVGASHRIDPTEPARRETDCYSQRDRRVTVRAARNEVVACQLVLTAGTEPARQVALTIGRLTGGETALPDSAVRAYRPLRVRTAGHPSWQLLRPEIKAPKNGWPDALVPLDAKRGGQPFDVAAGESVAIWLDVAIDNDAAPGVYGAPIEITKDGFPVEKVELQVRVLPITLPARPNTPTLVGVDVAALFRHHLRRDGKPYVPAGLAAGDPMAPQVKALLDGTLRMLHDHRCSPFLIGLYPSVSLDVSGRLQVGWETYDRTVAGYLDGTAFADGQGVSAWPIPADRSFPPPESYKGANSPLYAMSLQEYLRQSAAHFRQKGWFAQHFVWGGTPQGSAPEPPEQMERFGALVNKAKADLRLLTTAIPQSMKPFGWLGHEFDPALVDLVGIWAPPAQFFDVETMIRQRALGRTAWMMVDRPPFSPSLAIGAPIADARALPWQAARYPMNGILIPCANNWSGNPLGQPAPANSQWLVYPGGSFGLDGPIPSVRLKRLRQGLQDLDYLALLRQLGQKQMADTIACALFHYGGSAAYEDHFADGCQWPWVEGPAVWDLARQLMTDRIVQLEGGAGSGADAQFVRTVEWQRLIDAACELRLSCEGVRVRSLPRAESAGACEIELHLVLRNERPAPVTGRLRFGKLPVGWKPVADDVAVNALAPLGRARLSLVARATTIGTNEMGAAYVPVVFDAGASGQVAIQARLTQITANRLDQPIAVDGDLSDWPPGIRNVAGDFIRVVGEDPQLAGREPTSRAAQATLVFVGYDRERLYFAFNCAEDQVARLPSTSSNFVAYDGLLPTGDDLLEILIDPTNAGTGQPVDVYHVAIRPTGASLARRGVATQAGWGTSRYWPADVRVAPARQAKGWTVEVSMPLSAFGRAARANARWAINFARYQPRIGEYSSWSGARRYFYNTRTFGNLMWPAP